MTAPKGFPASKKYQKPIDGYTDAQSKTTSSFTTVQPSYDDRAGLDVVARFAVTVDSDTFEANSTTRIVKATSHSAKVGDFIKVTQSGSNRYVEISVISVPDADNFILATDLPATPSVGHTFDIMRYATPVLDATSGGVATTASPIQIVVDGVDSEVNMDLTNPLASVSVPVKNQSVYNESVRNDYSSTNVTTGAWVELIASTAEITFGVTVFDSGGYAMELGIGDSGSEQRLLLIPPGGFNGVIPLYIDSGSRLSIKAIGAATVDAGEFCMNLFY